MHSYWNELKYHVRVGFIQNIYWNHDKTHICEFKIFLAFSSWILCHHLRLDGDRLIEILTTSVWFVLWIACPPVPEWHTNLTIVPGQFMKVLSSRIVAMVQTQQHDVICSVTLFRSSVLASDIFVRRCIPWATWPFHITGWVCWGAK